MSEKKRIASMILRALRALRGSNNYPGLVRNCFLYHEGHEGHEDGLKQGVTPSDWIPASAGMTPRNYSIKILRHRGYGKGIAKETTVID